MAKRVAAVLVLELFLQVFSRWRGKHPQVLLRKSAIESEHLEQALQ